MKSEEILDEFWKEYENTIRYRLLGWIRGNKKLILKASSRSKDSNGFVLINEPRQVKTDKGNTYRCKLKAKITKDRIEFITTTYTIVVDSITGKNRVIILPSAKDYNYLITLDSHTLQRFNALVLKQPSLDFKTLVDSFIRADNEFSLQYDKDASGPINSYLEFGNDNYGMASYTEQSKTVDIKTFLLGSDLREWQKELGLSEFMPLEIYLQHKNRNKVFDSIVYPLSSQESEKDRQMREAWEEYEKHR